jgi:hypothetical protein
VWIDDFIEINPEARIDNSYFKSASFFKFPDNIISEKDAIVMSNQVKAVLTGHNMIGKLNYDLSLPPYDNTVYSFMDGGNLLVYWIVKIRELKDENLIHYSLLPMTIKNGLIYPWIEYNKEEDHDLYRIDFLQNKYDFTVDMKNVTVRYFSGTPFLDNSKTRYRQFIFIHTLLKINSLLNCINIVKIKNTAPKKLQKARIKRGKLPIQSYYTLKLKGVSKKYENIADKVDSQWSNRIHLCRGHFKRYTKDKPLLGKYVGLWWWQPIVRGRNKKGVIFKDYELTK